MTRLCTTVLISLALASPASADVTTKQKTGGKALTGAMSGESTQYIKGLKMRVDQTISGKATTTIIDAGSKQMMMIDHGKREADVYDMATFAGTLSKVPMSEMKTSITPTAQTRQIAGSTCTVYDVKVAMPMQMGNDGVFISLAGPYCLVKNGPGHADYAALYKAIAENGFFGDPRTAKAQPAHAKAMTEMYRKMAELGVPLASEVNVTFEGAGPMAAMMNKMGGSTMTQEVTSVSTDAIADSVFEVPAGYKVNKRS
jgi:hypothetical protein